MIQYEPEIEPFIEAFLERLIAGDDASDLPLIVAGIENAAECVIDQVIAFYQARHEARMAGLRVLRAILADPKATRGLEVVAELREIAEALIFHGDHALALKVNQVAVLIAIPAANGVAA